METNSCHGMNKSDHVQGSRKSNSMHERRVQRTRSAEAGMRKTDHSLRRRRSRSRGVVPKKDTKSSPRLERSKSSRVVSEKDTKRLDTLKRSQSIRVAKEKGIKSSDPHQLDKNARAIQHDRVVVFPKKDTKRSHRFERSRSSRVVSEKDTKRFDKLKRFKSSRMVTEKDIKSSALQRDVSPRVIKDDRVGTEPSRLTTSQSHDNFRRKDKDRRNQSRDETEKEPSNIAVNKLENAENSFTVKEEKNRNMASHKSNFARKKTIEKKEISGGVDCKEGENKPSPVLDFNSKSKQGMDLSRHSLKEYSNSSRREQKVDISPARFHGKRRKNRKGESVITNNHANKDATKKYIEVKALLSTAEKCFENCSTKLDSSHLPGKKGIEVSLSSPINVPTEEKIKVTNSTYQKSVNQKESGESQMTKEKYVTALPRICSQLEQIQLIDSCQIPEKISPQRKKESNKKATLLKDFLQGQDLQEMPPSFAEPSSEDRAYSFSTFTSTESELEDYERPEKRNNSVCSGISVCSTVIL